MKRKSVITGREIETLDEDENYYYFFWLDFPNTVCMWKKNSETIFEEYFMEVI